MPQVLSEFSRNLDTFSMKRFVVNLRDFRIVNENRHELVLNSLIVNDFFSLSNLANVIIEFTYKLPLAVRRTMNEARIVDDYVFDNRFRNYLLRVAPTTPDFMYQAQATISPSGVTNIGSVVNEPEPNKFWSSFSRSFYDVIDPEIVFSTRLLASKTIPTSMYLVNNKMSDVLKYILPFYAYYLNTSVVTVDGTKIVRGSYPFSLEVDNSDSKRIITKLVFQPVLPEIEDLMTVGSTKYDYAGVHLLNDGIIDKNTRIDLYIILLRSIHSQNEL